MIPRMDSVERWNATYAVIRAGKANGRGYEDIIVTLKQMRLPYTREIVRRAVLESRVHLIRTVMESTL